MKKWLKTMAISGAVALSGMQIYTAEATEKIKLTMNWTADSAHLGFAYAQKHGFYADEGLEVILEEGRGSSVTAQLVASGQSELGYADAGAILNVASQGAPIKIVSTIWKAGQYGLVFLEESGIKEPKDLIGKKIAYSPGTALLPLLEAFLNANAIDKSSLELISASPKSFAGLLSSGQVDAVTDTPEDLVIPMLNQGIKATNMYFYEHGVPIISLSLVARQDKIAANPEPYKKFINASLKGWAEAMKNPEGAVDALFEVFPDVSSAKKNLLTSAKYSFESVCPSGAKKIGVTSDKTWQEVFHVMTTATEFPKDRPITEFYTNDLLPSNPPDCP